MQYQIVAIPSGHAEVLLTLLAKNGGAISREDADQALSRHDPVRTLVKRPRRITDALSKIKTPIRESIARSGKYALDDVLCPIQHVAPGWVALIQIGYAVENDDQKLEFKTTTDLQGG
ncbi:hypothetical protein [Thalassoglobus neptunius]|nr:hypothetical protein [Thalassoglobus neptunius]